jgi:hypothetical protein
MTEGETEVRRSCTKRPVVTVARPVRYLFALLARSRCTAGIVSTAIETARMHALHDHSIREVISRNHLANHTRGHLHDLSLPELISKLRQQMIPSRNWLTLVSSSMS